MLPHVFHEKIAAYQARVHTTLQQAILSRTQSSTVLQDVMRYATLNGGKRLRPILVYATGECLGQSCEALDNIAENTRRLHRLKWV